MTWGLLVFAVGLPFDIIGLSMGSPNSPLGFLRTFAQIALLLWFLRKEFQNIEHYKFSHLFSLLIITALYSGILAGAYNHMAYNVFYPEFFEQFSELYTQSFDEMGMTEEEKEEGLKLASRMYQSPFFHVVTASLGNMFTFGLLGVLYHFIIARRQRKL